MAHPYTYIQDTSVKSCSANSTLKKEAKLSPENPIGFQQTTRRCIPEDSNLHFSLPYKSVNFVKLAVFFFIFSNELSAYPSMQVKYFINYIIVPNRLVTI
jgi:hypothetical protein